MIQLDVYNIQVEKEKEQESWFQRCWEKGDARVGMTLPQVRDNNSQKYFQVIKKENLQTIIQYYFILFEEMVAFQEKELLHLTLDVLLDDKHKFMSKLSVDTNGALNHLRVEEILSMVEIFITFLA